MKITIHHYCGWYSHENENGLPLESAVPEWAYRGMVLPDMICPECGGSGVQLQWCADRDLKPIAVYPGCVLKVGSHKHGAYYQSYIPLPDWEYWGMDMLQGKTVNVLAWRNVEQKLPVVWRVAITSNRRLMVPSGNFEPGELLHIAFVF